MYSTAIGLILKGYEYMEINKEKDYVKAEVKNEKEMQEEVLEEAKGNEEKVTEKTKVKRKFFENIKKSFNEIFDENDSKME
jgi:cell division ATPase FtsA